MTRCLVCHQPFFEKPSWTAFLMLDLPALVCDPCEEKLIPITGRRCTRCSRSLDRLAGFHQAGDTCRDCSRWEENATTKNLLEKNVSLYEYDPFLKEWLTIYKFRGDAAIAAYFSRSFAALYKKEYSNYTAVEIPLSEERLVARGFNQSSLLMRGWAEETGILSRQTGEKQSKRNRKERIAQAGNDPFKADASRAHLIDGKNVVLVDDIYTTGTTVRQAARVLLANGANKVASMTIAR